MKIFFAIAFATMLLSACGTTTGDRGLSGAGIGAGIGIVGGPPGVVVGGLVGAGAGMLSSPGQVDLGKPLWKR